mgnify:CR=1 FL=1
MTNDRTYWRLCDTARLIEEARNSGHELCIVLGERLQDKVNLTDDLRKLRDNYELVGAANICMRAEIEALERELKNGRGN